MMIFLRRQGKNKQLNDKLKSIQANFENNYKDAAQMSLAEYIEILQEEIQNGKMKETEQSYYMKLAKEYKERLRNFHH